MPPGSVQPWGGGDKGRGAGNDGWTDRDGTAGRGCAVSARLGATAPPPPGPGGPRRARGTGCCWASSGARRGAPHRRPYRVPRHAHRRHGRCRRWPSRRRRQRGRERRLRLWPADAPAWVLTAGQVMSGPRREQDHATSDVRAGMRASAEHRLPLACRRGAADQLDYRRVLRHRSRAGDDHQAISPPRSTSSRSQPRRLRHRRGGPPTRTALPGAGRPEYHLHRRQRRNRQRACAGEHLRRRGG